jgi:protein gp37
VADNSTIEWTDATWNPVTGCTKVSPGCDHCYAERIVERFKGKGAFEQVTLNEDRLSAPLRWRKPRRVFVNSMSDLFHDAVPDDYIAQAFAVMAESPQHTFQVLTKRHGRMRTLLSSESFEDAVSAWIDRYQDGTGTMRDDDWYPLRNVWLGVSVEDQKRADLRVPALLDIPAAVRFLSCEPLLGPVDLAAYLDRWEWKNSERRSDVGHVDWYGPRLGWVIVGGESGPGARPMHPDWARSLRDQCAIGEIPFFFKQWGTWAPADVHGWYSRAQWVEYQEDGGREAAFMHAAKSKSLRELDGRTWDEYPQEALRAG